MAGPPPSPCHRRLRLVAPFLLALGTTVGCTWPVGAEPQGAPRAVIVGIDRYRPPADSPTAAGERRLRDLEGATNDARAMRDLLVGRYGFSAGDVRLLLDEEATRAAILDALRRLVEGAGRGDLLIFYFSGHGSQLVASGAEEADRLDETLVPADAGAGAADLRDKELRHLFNRAIDRGAELVVILDACHSGSAVRGYPRPDRGLRRVAAREVVARESDRESSVPPPEERGALVLAAARPGQLASEIEDDEGLVWGRFTHALHEALLAAAPDQSAERLFLRVRARMKADGSLQEPELRATDERRARPLFGGDGRSRAETVVAVSTVETEERTALLEGGVAMGLHRRSRLVVDPPAGPPILLEVTESVGAGRSRAAIVAGDAARLSSGDLARVVSWGAPDHEPLRLEVSAGRLSVAELRDLVRVLGEMPHAWRQVLDPTEETPDHVLRFEAGRWVLVGTDGAPRPLAATSPHALARELAARARGSLFLDLPVPREIAEPLRRRLARLPDASERSSGGVHYRLVGRAVSSGDGARLESAWVRPGALRGDGEALPPRTWWVPLHEEPGPDSAVDRLVTSAADAATLHRWLTFGAPPERFAFPYLLRVRSAAPSGADAGDGRWLPEGGRLVGGVRYEAVLVADSGDLASRLADAGRRFVYVCHFDATGRGRMIFPLLPDDERPLPPAGEAPAEILLTPMSFTSPWGAETFVYLTSVSPLPALDCDLPGLSATRRGEPGWSVERLFLRSSPANSISP